MLDLTGQRFGKLTVLMESGRLRTPGQVRRQWLCVCDCGNDSIVVQYHLTKGNTKSCGCLKSENEKSVKHGHRRKGKRTQAYETWTGMKKRCYDSSCRAYKWYGGKGITVCARWLESFANFYEDMGDPPTGLTLDRREGTEGYSKDNCRWATSVEQAVNKVSVILYEHNGRSLCLKHWAREIGMPYLKLYKRVITRGWSFHRAISE